jgi:LruC domain-containing protein
MKKVAQNSTDTVEVSFTKEGNVYLLTEDIKDEINTTYILELNYKNGITDITKAATVKPFIFRNEDGNKRWEVHIPFEAPTAKMNMTYFGTEDDRSVISEGKYYVRSGNYPFAFCLAGITIDKFMDTLLPRNNEKIKISDLYPTFLPWATSNGTQYQDWYIHPKE